MMNVFFFIHSSILCFVLLGWLIDVVGQVPSDGTLGRVLNDFLNQEEGNNAFLLSTLPQQQ